jgi:hypothetical protein
LLNTLNLSSFLSFIKSIKTIEFKPGDKINKKLLSLYSTKDQKKVKAVYLIYGIKNAKKELIYIGKAGSVKNDGSFKNQGIDRLKRRRGKIYSQEWYENILKDYDRLVFKIVELEGISPAFIEAFLLQKYLDKCKRLPRYNKTL